MGERILLVEGDDDLHVMSNLFGIRGIPDRFCVERPKMPRQSVVAEREPGRGEEESGGGIGTLLESIPTWLLRSELECLAVILDADDKGPQARWQSIRHRLLSAKFRGVPQDYGGHGTVFELSLASQTPRSIRFGAWIMPDNRSHGMIEDFFLALIRPDDAMLPLVDQFLASIPPVQQRFAAVHRSKARVHAWLAVGERPGRPMGQAIKADKYLDKEHPSLDPFFKWIQAALLE
jgi:hypothetical protein